MSMGFGRGDGGASRAGGDWVAGGGGRLVGLFLDFYGTVAAGDVRAVESICQAVIEDHGLDGEWMGAAGRGKGFPSGEVREGILAPAITPAITPATPAREGILEPAPVGEAREVGLAPAPAAAMAREWGMRYFAAIERDGADGFRTLREIEHDTLVETVEGLIEGFDARPYIERLNAYLAGPPLFPEVQEVVRGLRLPVCIVSNADERELRMALDTHGLKFDYIVTSESARSYKPHPGIFRQALELTGWPAERVLHVGDSLHSDVGGAAPLGIRTAWVNRAERISDIGTAVPDYTWTDLRPMLTIR